MYKCAKPVKSEEQVTKHRFDERKQKRKNRTWDEIKEEVVILFTSASALYLHSAREAHQLAERRSHETVRRDYPSNLFVLTESAWTPLPVCGPSSPAAPPCLFLCAAAADCGEGGACFCFVHGEDSNRPVCVRGGGVLACGVRACTRPGCELSSLHHQCSSDQLLLVTAFCFSVAATERKRRNAEYSFYFIWQSHTKQN